MANSKELSEQYRREQQLIKETFSTESGRKLLNILANQYVWNPINTPDTAVLHGRVAIQELVINFMTATAGKSNG